MTSQVGWAVARAAVAGCHGPAVWRGAQQASRIIRAARIAPAAQVSFFSTSPHGLKPPASIGDFDHKHIPTVRMPLPEEAMTRVTVAPSGTKHVRAKLPKVEQRDVVRWALGVLNQKKMLLERVSPADYTKVNARMQGSIGEHMRHSLQHFEQCVQGVSPAAADVLASSSPPSAPEVYDGQEEGQGGAEGGGGGGRDMPLAEYDARARRTAVQQDPHAALEAVESLKVAIKALTPESLVSPLGATFMVEETTGRTQSFPSTVERELAFCAHHATHHNAVMRWMASKLRYDLPADFGLGMSTSLHRQGEDEL